MKVFLYLEFLYFAWGPVAAILIAFLVESMITRFHFLRIEVKVSLLFSVQTLLFTPLFTPMMLSFHNPVRIIAPWWYVLLKCHFDETGYTKFEYDLPFMAITLIYFLIVSLGIEWFRRWRRNRVGKGSG